MFAVIGDEIRLTRGDTFLSEVSLARQNGDPYTPEAGDVIRFVVKHEGLNCARTEYVDQNPVIEKIVPNDTLLVKLLPNDTKQLGFGNYVYDLEITFENGDVDTFINNAPFILLPEVD